MNKNAMSLLGGITAQYLDIVRRYLDGPAPAGRRVRFLNDNGRNHEREEANKILFEGGVYIVQEIFVYRSCSEVVLKQFPDKRFNTVMFEDVVE